MIFLGHLVTLASRTAAAWARVTLVCPVGRPWASFPVKRWSRVPSWSGVSRALGEKVAALVPRVMSFWEAQRTAL